MLEIASSKGILVYKDSKSAEYKDWFLLFS